MKPSTPLSWFLVTLVFQFLKKQRRLLVAMPSHTSLGFTKMESLKIHLPMKSSRLSWWGLRAIAFHLENCLVAMPLSKNCMSWDWNSQKKTSSHCLLSSNLWQTRNTRSQMPISAPLFAGTAVENPEGFQFNDLRLTTNADETIYSSG